MITMRDKQLVLKPQDFLVALKIALNENRKLTYADLGHELAMSTSVVYAAVERATICRLLIREHDKLRAINSSLQEFILHGIKYVFPPIMGSINRGMPTGTAANPLKKFFSQREMLEFVWPDSSGELRGISLQPLCPTVPHASRIDSNLYEALVLIDALRVGAAREREIAENELIMRLS